MPDDTLDFTPVEPEDLLAPTEERFYECGRCAIQPGSPRLCEECLERREVHLSSGRSWRPTYYRLQNDQERRTYLSYLAFYRDGGDELQPLDVWTEEDLDREFPDRHEPPYREPGSRRAPTLGSRLVRHFGPLLPSIWGPMQVSRLNVQDNPTPPEPPPAIEWGTWTSWVRNPASTTEALREVLPPPEPDNSLNAYVAGALAGLESVRVPEGVLEDNLRFIRDALRTPLMTGVDVAVGEDLTYVTVVHPAPSVEPEASVEGASRFEREPEVEEGYATSSPLPDPRESIGAVAPHVQRYFRRNDGARAAWEKLHGPIGDISLPTRFERINWDKE